MMTEKRLMSGSFLLPDTDSVKGLGFFITGHDFLFQEFDFEILEEGADVSLIKKAFEFFTFGFENMGFDLGAFAGAVIDIVDGIDTKDQMSAGDQDTTDFGKNEIGILPGKVMETKICDDHFKRLIFKGKAIEHVEA